ncbi:hypothetical protein GQ600_14265 [Phytophthora cactorum]|nr:hypothetical protein GQ600_14265 [Phytophthora cactorum]
MYERLVGPVWDLNETKGKYVNPDDSKVLYEEAAVEAYALGSRLLDVDKSVDAECAADAERAADVEVATAEDSSASFDDVRASQIYTSAEISQRTVNELFGLSSSSSSSDVDISHQRLLGKLICRLPSLRMLLLSEASGAESDTQPVRVPAASTDRAYARGVRSGQSEDGVEIDNDDDNGYDRDQTEEDYDDLSEDDAVSMGEAFVESLQDENVGDCEGPLDESDLPPSSFAERLIVGQEDTVIAGVDAPQLEVVVNRTVNRTVEYLVLAANYETYWLSRTVLMLA